jgi:hypothetical protein
MLPYLCKMYVNFVLTKSSFYMIFVLGSYVPIPFSYNGIQVSIKSIQWQIYSRCTCQTGRKSYMN